MDGVNIHQPKKRPRGGKLTDEERHNNRLISRVRVVVEHVISGIKRCRIVKDIFRTTLSGYDDEVIELACALRNFRSYHRHAVYLFLVRLFFHPRVPRSCIPGQQGH